MSVSLIILGILMVVSYILSLLGFVRKGIIIDDNYVFSSKEKRQNMNKNAYYLQSAIIFLCIGSMFLLHILRRVTDVVYLTYLAFIVGFATAVYAIASHYAIKKN